MTRFSTFAAALTAATTLATAASADMQTSQIKTHPSQGEVKVVADATAMIHRDPNGVFVSFDTNGLTPGNVNTLWFVVINNPAACETQPCTPKDVLKRSDIVSADVGYGGGLIVDEDGTAKFVWRQEKGALDGGWFSAGLGDTSDAEIHLAINDHGPIIEGREFEMLNSYRDGCTDESIPAPMPATARAQGEAGPNQCRLMQFTIFQPVGAGS